MVRLSNNLELAKCPHCAIANPNLGMRHNLETLDHAGGNKRLWYIYACGRCGGLVVASGTGHLEDVREVIPESPDVDITIPDTARVYLQQALNSTHAPAGAVMLCASAVDAMLKHRGYKTGSLYNRIDQAAKDHEITNEMARWAHDVRLDANDQRHADEEATLPNEEDARRAIDFVVALGQIMFVLPARVRRGLEEQSE